MVPQELIHALMDVRRRLSAEQWRRLGAALESWTDLAHAPDAAAVLPDVRNGDAIWMLNRSLQQRGLATWQQAAAVIATVDAWAESAQPAVDVVWTGPDNGLFPVRRFDQVLYDLISQASRRVLIVTFAAHRVGHLCRHLTAALNRGVSLTLVLEAEEDSAGQLTHDAIRAFADLPPGGPGVYRWPLEKRDRNAAGRPGKLHAKCAVGDDLAIVCSGNLTDDAFNRNMELGLMVRNAATADSICNHFQALIHEGILTRMEV